MSKPLNREVDNKIRDALAANPGYSEDQLLELLVRLNNTRLPKPALKLTIRDYFLRNCKPTQPTTPTPPAAKQNQQQLSNGLPRKKKKIDQSGKQQDFTYEPTDADSIQLMGGIDQVVSKVRNQILLAIKCKPLFNQIQVEPPKRYCIIGSMGCGKTRLGKAILHSASTLYGLNAYYFTALQPASQIDDSLDKLFKQAVENTPCIVFIDDLQQVCSKENKKQSSSLSCLVGNIDKIEGKQVYLLGATSYPEKVDISLKRAGRFDQQITIDNPNDVARKQIFQKLINRVKTSLKNQEADIDDLISRTAGYVAADLVKLVNKAALEAAQRIDKEQGDNGVNVEEEKQIILQDFKLALAKVQPLCKKDGFTTIPDVTLEDVGALGDLKQELIESIILPIQKRDKYRTMHIALNAGVLLFGPPGCGKTMLAKAIANQAKASFITVKGPELLSKYVGESEQSVRKVFQRARLSAPCIIFFDEFDALAPKRSDSGNQVTERVVNTLLNELNGVEDRKMVFVIAATNRKDIIDEAILRSGRIEKHLKVPLPTREDRLQILKTITKKLCLSKNVNLEQVASHTFCQGFSGADLQHLVNQTSIIAITHHQHDMTLTQQDFLRALAKLIANKHA